MNKIIVFLILLSLITFSCSKELPIGAEQADSFVKFYGNTFSDIGYDVKQTSDNGYVITGMMTNVDRGKAEDNDMVLIKTDEFGNEASWSPKFFGGALDDCGNNIQITSDNGYVIIGYKTDSSSQGFNTDIFLVRLNDIGDTLWTKTYGGSLNDKGYSVVETKDGGFVLTGYIGDIAKGKDIILIKTDNNGNVEWQKVPGGGSNDDIGESVIEIDDGYIIVGNTLSNGQNLGITNGVIIKTGLTGTPSGTIYLGGSSETNCQSIVKNTNNEYVFSGTTTSSSDEKSIFVGKIENIDVFSSTSFNVVSLSGDYDVSDMKYMNNEFIITGTRKITTDKDIFLIKTDLNANINFSNFFGNIGDQEAYGIDLTKDGGFVIVGSNLVDENSLITLVKANKIAL